MIKYYNKVKNYFVNRPILRLSLYIVTLTVMCVLSFSHWPIILTEYPRTIIVFLLFLLCLFFSDCNPKR